jgi:hypothetical protein
MCKTSKVSESSLIIESVTSRMVVALNIFKK